LKPFFGVKNKILKFFDADPGWKKFGSGIRGWKRFGYGIRDGKNSDPY
jgi:hypothetical protein